jgi:hypothetical protein
MSIRHLLPGFAVVFLTITPTVPAQDPPAAQGKAGEPAPAPFPGRKELTVSPVAAPTPALRYELLPRLRDRTPGNAAVGYLRAVILRPTQPNTPKEATDLDAKLTRWEELPADRLPVPEMKEFLKQYRTMFREVDEAARMGQCDWQQAGRLKPEDIGVLLPTVQGHREVLRYLSFRYRVELAEGRYDAATRTLQTEFQFGKHVGEGPTMIQMLVGIALAQGAVTRVEDFIRQPGAPNVYWALTALPRPFIDPRPAIESEGEFMTSFVPGLKDLEKGPLSEEQAVRSLEQSILGLAQADEVDNQVPGLTNLAGAVGRAAYITFQGPAAKKDLLARGWPKADVDAMPAAQAIILRAVAVHRELWDDQAKLFFLPYPEVALGTARAEQKIKDRRKTYKDDIFFNVLALGYPALRKVHEAHARLERRIALLRAVEAVRLSAALHNGQPPKDLADVTAVPVPDDPNTGSPFGYAVRGGTFILTAPPPTGEAAAAGNSFEYVVTVRK